MPESSTYGVSADRGSLRYNRVMHRFAVFLAGFALLGAMWAGFALSYLAA